VLAAGVGGSWPAAADDGAPPSTPHLPWQAAVFVADGGAANGDGGGGAEAVPPADSTAAATTAAVVWFIPHYLTDGTSVDILCGALVDALNAGDASAAAAATAAVPPPTVPLPPAMTTVFPPRGGAAGAALATATVLVSGMLEGLTRARVRAVVPAAPPAASPATADGGATTAAARRSMGAVDVVVPAPVMDRLRAGAKGASVSVGAALVAALGVALADSAVVAPRSALRNQLLVCVPMNGRSAAAADGGGVPADAVGCYVGAVDVALAVPPPRPPAVAGADGAKGAAPPGNPRLWAAAAAAHAAIHAPSARAASLRHLGVATTLGVAPSAGPYLDALVADPVVQGRLLKDPFVSNVGRCARTEAANGRGGRAGAAVTAIRLMDWEGQLGAPLGIYVCTVGGGASLVMTWAEPMVDATAAKAVLAAVVRLIEAA